MSDGLLLALPKGRIARELTPLLARAGIEPEAAFADDGARQLRFCHFGPGARADPGAQPRRRHLRRLRRGPSSASSATTC